VFKTAVKKKVKLKSAIIGPSGSGKTMSALRLAAGIGKKIAVIDTENGSASLYSDKVAFDTLEIAAPYTVNKYIDAINAAVAGGYDVLLIDSITHCWSGEGGLLAEKEALDSRGGNSFTNWGSITKKHELFKAALLNAPIHTICTMRSKQEYIIESTERGKQAPRKVGMAPIQRDGMEYEFTVVLDVAVDHTAICSKDRTGLFDGFNGVVTEATGKKLVEWLDGGQEERKPEAVKPQPRSQDITKPTVKDLNDLAALGVSKGLGQVEFVEVFKKFTGLQTMRDLTSEGAAAFREYLGTLIHPIVGVAEDIFGATAIRVTEDAQSHNTPISQLKVAETASEIATRLQRAAIEESMKKHRLPVPNYMVG